MPKSRQAAAIFSPSNSRAMNLRRSSMRLHSFQGTFALPQKAQLCNPCARNELSPLSQEGQAIISTDLAVHCICRRSDNLPLATNWQPKYVNSRAIGEPQSSLSRFDGSTCEPFCDPG